MSVVTSPHAFRAWIKSRDPNVWATHCNCGEVWTEGTYEAGEDQWRKHVHAVTGKAPKPMGDRADRWAP